MEDNNMKRGLNSRHISMIAIGGAIGTGLFVATGSVVAQAGPGGAILAYLLIGIMLYFNVVNGELATFYPVSGSFSSYATRFVGFYYGMVILHHVGISIQCRCYGSFKRFILLGYI